MKNISQQVLEFVDQYYVNMIFFISLISVVGSLYFSNILQLPPCDLCWYQRIFMYSIPFVSGIGLLANDKNVYRYIIPFSGTGMVMAFYHYLIQMSDFARGLVGCSPSNPCTDKQIEYLGFITIPLLSFLAFTAINILLVRKVWTLRQSA